MLRRNGRPSVCIENQQARDNDGNDEDCDNVDDNDDDDDDDDAFHETLINQWLLGIIDKMKVCRCVLSFLQNLFSCTKQIDTSCGCITPPCIPKEER